MIASTQTNHPMALTQKGQKPQTSIEYACSRLKQAGLRITQPRISILTSLINRSVPATIEQIHADLPPDTCDLVTVYRCLAVFQDIGLVRLTYFHNGASAYQITLDSNTVPPYHIISKKDNQVQELDPESASELRAVITKIENELRAKGYDRVSHIVEFFVDSVQVANDPRSMGDDIPAVLQMRGSAPITID